MFHVSDNLFFGRTKEDRVRVIKMPKNHEGFPDVNATSYPEAEFALSIDPDSWSSIVAAMTKSGENGETFAAARKFFDS